MKRDMFDGIETIESLNLAHVTGGKSNEDIAAEQLEARTFGDKKAADLIASCRAQFPASATGDKRLEDLMFSQDGLTAKQTNCVGRAIRGY